MEKAAKYYGEIYRKVRDKQIEKEEQSADIKILAMKELHSDALDELFSMINVEANNGRSYLYVKTDTEKSNNLKRLINDCPFVLIKYLERLGYVCTKIGNRVSISWTPSGMIGK